MFYGFPYSWRLGSAEQQSDEGGNSLAGKALTMVVTEKDEMMFGNINSNRGISSSVPLGKCTQLDLKETT